MASAKKKTKKTPPPPPPRRSSPARGGLSNAKNVRRRNGNGRKGRRRQSDQMRANAARLEKNIKINSLERKLRNRPDAKTLEKQNVRQASSHGAYAGIATKLEREMKKNAVHDGIRTRPERDELLRSGVIKHAHVAPSLAGASAALERNMRKSRVTRDLDPTARRDKKSLVNAGYLSSNHGRVDPSLESPMKNLETAFKKDALNRRISHRPDLDELYKRGILNPEYQDLDPSLHATAGQLEDAFKKDYLSHKLRSRPPVHNLHTRGIADKRTVAYGHARTTAEMLEDHLKSRVAPELLPDNVVPVRRFHAASKLDRTLAGVGRKLERNLHRDNLSRGLKNRKSTSELRRAGILIEDDMQIDASLISKKKALERSFKSDALARHLRSRPSPADVEIYKRVPDFLNDEYVSPLPPRKSDEPMNLEYAADEVRRCLYNINRFKNWLEYMD